MPAACVVHATANTIEMLALYLGMLDADFTVTEPPEPLTRPSRLSKRFRVPFYPQGSNREFLNNLHPTARIQHGPQLPNTNQVRST